MNRIAYSYGCIMAPIGEPVASAMRAWGESIPKQYIYNDDKGEMGVEKNCHVTVKYGIHPCDPDDVRARLSGFPPFQITIGRTSVFHGDGDFVVLKAGIRSRDLFSLNRHVCRVFETTDTHPEYRPHATIAYMVKNEEDPYYYRKYFTDNFDGMTVEIDELEFSTADGDKVMIPLLGKDMNMRAMQLLNMARDVIEPPVSRDWGLMVDKMNVRRDPDGIEGL